MSAETIVANERVIAKLRKHWIILLRDTIGTVILGFLPFLLWFLIATYAADVFPYLESVPAAWLQIAAAVWILVIWLTLAVLWTNYYLDFWIVTSHRIINIEQLELFNRRVVVWNLDRVQDITTKVANALQTFLGYGTIEVYTAGNVLGVNMEGVPHPEKVRTLILDQIERVGTLEKINEKQDDLLHFVSHEVKAHLTKNKAAFASILEGDYGAIPGKLAKMADTALTETEKGVKTVMSVLDNSDTKTGTMIFEKKPFDVKASVLEVAKGFADSAKEKGVALDIRLGVDTFVALGDKAKFEEHVIRNLLDNAVRYTPHGGIRVELSRTRNRIRLSVADSGVGITPEDMQKLFTKSGKGRDSSMINKESTGYGLYIAKSVVEALGGSMWAESAGQGQGTRFFVELPVA